MCLYETLRLSAVRHLVNPHIVSEDMTIGDYEVKKGAALIPNLPYLHLNDVRWREPFRFNPEHWRSAIALDAHEMYLKVWSVGSRSCPAAEWSEWICIRTICFLIRHFKFTLKNPCEDVDYIDDLINDQSIRLMAEERGNFKKPFKPDHRFDARFRHLMRFKAREDGLI